MSELVQNVNCGANNTTFKTTNGYYVIKLYLESYTLQ